MLGKVIKYEFRALWRQLAALVIGISCGIAALMIIRLLLNINPNNMTTTIVNSTLFFSVMLCIIGGFAPYCIAIIRFFRSMSGTEAYLTFTLPVKNSIHIWARIISSTIVLLLSLTFAVIGLILTFIGTPVLGGIWELFAKNTGDFISVFFFIYLLIFVSGISGIFLIFASISIGTVLSKNRQRGAVIAYFLISAIWSAIYMFILIPILAAYPDIFIFAFDFVFMVSSVHAGLWRAFALITFINIILATLYFFIIRHFFVKKLNIE